MDAYYVTGGLEAARPPTGLARQAAEHAEPSRRPGPDSRAKGLEAYAEEVLSLEGVSLSFGGVKALHDIDLDVRRGEIRAIIGPNGAGKSSLINIMSGVYRPDRGLIFIGNESHDQVPTARLAELGIARTFQNLALFKGLSVIDNILTGLSFRRRHGVLAQVFGLPGARREEREAREKARAVIAFLGLGRHAHQLAGSLPYGLQKRVELARALVAEPRILLLDEPMAGMTATEKQDMAAHVQAIRARFGTTIILIEHDIGVVMGLSDRVAVLDYGRKIADGTPAAVRADEAVIDAYLGRVHDETDREA